MPFTNFRNAYELDPQDYDYQNAGGLPGLLRDAMHREGLQQGSQVSPTAKSAPNPYSDNYGNPQGLFGRLLALQTNQGFPIGVDQGDASLGAAPQATPVQYRIPLPGPLPFPPNGPQSAPQIPMPHLPEPWPTIGKIMQLLPRLVWDRLKQNGNDEQGPGSRESEDKLDEEAIGRRRRKRGTPGSPLPLPPFWPPKSDDDPENSQSGGTGGGSGGVGGTGGEGAEWDKKDPWLDIYRRCMRDAERDEEAWQAFCEDLPPDARQLRAMCRGNHTPESRKGFCGQFTPGWTR